MHLNGFVPNLQVAAQVVSVMTARLGNPIPSSVILEKIHYRVPQGGGPFRCRQ